MWCTLHCGALSLASSLDIDNILKAVEEVKNWGDFLQNLIGHYSPNDEVHLKDTVQQFIQGRGLYQPSWRAVIFALDVANEINLADQIRHHGEPVQGVLCVQI